jgi:pimeloyl-ACP methyl ester carboxylesterase
MSLTRSEARRWILVTSALFGCNSNASDAGDPGQADREIVGFEQWISPSVAKPGIVQSYLVYDAERNAFRDSDSPLARDHEAIIYVTTVDADANKPWCTLLHGFPASSMDWQLTIRELRDFCRILTFDYPGFGASSKNLEFGRFYGNGTRSKMVEALWSYLEVHDTYLFSHDFSAEVVLELLAARSELSGLAQTTATGLTKIVLLNSGYYIANHERTLLQEVVLEPGCGKTFLDSVTGSRELLNVFQFAFREVISDIFHVPPTEKQLDDYWRMLTYLPNDLGDGQGSFENGPGLSSLVHTIHYITDKHENAARWEPHLLGTTVPIKFVWGTRDTQTNPFFLHGQSADRKAHVERTLEQQKSGLCQIAGDANALIAAFTQAGNAPPPADPPEGGALIPGFWGRAQALGLIEAAAVPPPSEDNFRAVLAPNQHGVTIELVGFPAGHYPHVENADLLVREAVEFFRR